MAIVTPADRPKWVRNRCVIEVFGGVLCVVTLPFLDFSVGVRASVIGLSQISSFSLRSEIFVDATQGWCLYETFDDQGMSINTKHLKTLHVLKVLPYTA